MTHKCSNCKRTPKETNFAFQYASKNLRSMCNTCRSSKDRGKLVPTEQPPQSSQVSQSSQPRDSWLDLCADDRPDWGWNHRHIPKNHGKSQEFQI